MIRRLFFLFALPFSVTTSVVADEALERIVDLVDGKCAFCHGEEGESSSELFPMLAGQNADYIAKQLNDFQSGRRKGAMTEMVGGLSAEDIRLIGRYFAAKPPLAHPEGDAELAAVGRYLYRRGNPFSAIPACASCHGEGGGGSEKLPRLAGQRSVYVAKQLRAFHQRERTNDNAVMHTVAAKLTELEIEGLAHYIAGME